MDPEQNQYHFSFFKPSTESARHNRNMVVQFVLIWAVAIFGFQILLKILEKPTPEPAYLLYEKSWPAIEAGRSYMTDLSRLGTGSTFSTGKGYTFSLLTGAALDNAVSWFAWQIADSLQQEMLLCCTHRF